MMLRGRRQRALGILLFCLLILPAPPLLADEIVTLTAISDATLLKALPATNDGATAIIRALGEANNTSRSLVQFDLTGISSTAAVKVGHLRGIVSTPPVTSRNQAAHRVTGATAWTEGGVTWNTRDGATAWGTAGGDFSATAIDTQPSGTTAGATLTWHILTDGVVSNIPQDWLTTPANNRGLLIKDTVETDSDRAVLRCLYSGATTVNVNGTVTVALPNLNATCNGTITMARSFLVFQTNNSIDRPVAMEIRGAISSATQVQFTRVTNEGPISAVNVSWYVVEFARGVNVQRGTFAMAAATTNVPIAAVAAVNQAFALWSKTPTNTDTQYGNNDPGVAEVTTTTNLQFRVNTAAATHTIAWQVVEFTNALDISVQKGNIATMAAGTASVTVAITAVDPARSFLLINYQVGAANSGGNEGRYLLRGRLTGCAATCNQVTVDRSVTGLAVTQISYQVVTLNTGASVQTNTTNFPIGTATLSPALAPAIDTSRTFAMLSTQGGGGQNVGRTTMAAPTAQSLGASTWVTTLAAASITLTRLNTAAAADASWYVVQMNNAAPGQASYSSKEDATPANRPQLDVSILRDVTVGVVTPGISEVTLNFTFPCGGVGCNYLGTLIARKNGGVAPSFAPVDGTSYAVGSQPVVGETIVSDTNDFADSPTNVQALDENGADSVITPSTLFSYKLYSRDNSIITGAAVPAPPHYSFGSAATATTTTLAGGGINKNWSYKTLGTVLAPPGLDPGNMVIAGSDDNNVHSMSPITGARNYQPAGSTGTTGGAIQTRPAVISLGDNQIADCDSVTPGNQPCSVTYVGSNDGRVHAFNATTGQLIWVTPAPGSPGSLVAVGGIIQGGIAVQLKNFANVGFTPATDLVFVGTREASTSANSVHALNGSTGAIVWTFSPGNMDGVNSTPAVDYTNNVIWVTSLSNGNSQPSLWKINSVTGAGISNFSLGDLSGSPTLSGDNRVVYAVTDSGNLVAVRNDIASCANTLVTGATSGTGFPIPIASGSIRDDNIFFTTTNGSSTVRKAHFLYNAACGGETFTAAAGYTNPSGIGTLSGPMFNPITAAAIYVGSSDGNLYKIDPANGTVLASRTVNAGVFIGEPSFDVYLLKLYVGDAQGRIYSFAVF